MLLRRGWRERGGGPLISPLATLKRTWPAASCKGERAVSAHFRMKCFCISEKCWQHACHVWFHSFTREVAALRSSDGTTQRDLVDAPANCASRSLLLSVARDEHGPTLAWDGSALGVESQDIQAPTRLPVTGPAAETTQLHQKIEQLTSAHLLALLVSEQF